MFDGLLNDFCELVGFERMYHCMSVGNPQFLLKDGALRSVGETEHELSFYLE